ncbi:hypothetical protein, partial [Bacteroides caecigallinarum]|uniref:hypothetical protein n=1 Tax=Bacteroides caecigallinarum TaxID=1411144 RepID=UPI00195E2ED3
KNYPAEVCLLSHEVTLKPLSSALHGSVRFLRNPLPAHHSASLAIGLPAICKQEKYGLTKFRTSN